MSVAPKAVDLDALTNPARQGAVSVRGTAYPVRPISHAATFRIAAATEAEVASEIVAAMAAAAREAVPEMPDAVFGTLTYEQVAAIVGIAREGADAVEQLIAEHARAQGAAAGKAP